MPSGRSANSSRANARRRSDTCSSSAARLRRSVLQVKSSNPKPPSEGKPHCAIGSIEPLPAPACIAGGTIVPSSLLDGARLGSGATASWGPRATLPGNAVSLTGDPKFGSATPASSGAFAAVPDITDSLGDSPKFVSKLGALWACAATVEARIPAAKRVINLLFVIDFILVTKGWLLGRFVLQLGGAKPPRESPDPTGDHPQSTNARKLVTAPI